MKGSAILATAALGCIFAAAPARAITYELVTVGDPGNASDDTSFGAVDYVYRIGKYEVSIGQYTAFLNAVAASDTYGLYNGNMGGIPNVAGISRTGSDGSYTYAVVENDGSSANRPVTSTSWFSAARFANWMSNGQPTGAQDGSTTEDGAYPLNGATSGNAVVRNGINPNTGAPPTFRIPLETEWYKAAYYDPSSNDGAGGYFSFATRSDTLPENLVGDSPNQANYLSEVTGYSVNQSPVFSTTQNYLTDGGAYSASASAYGTFDQTGNVWEWNDFDGTPGYSRGLRGGAYTSTPPYLQSSYRMGYGADRFNPNGGFRLASPAE
jgi:formylglycine-generating enzyme